MITIEVTPEVAKEIKEAIVFCQVQIGREMLFSAHLRKYDVIEKYKTQIEIYKQALINGVI